jgi:predicted metal-dependent HD superfamily phosphohydrolase
MQFEKAGLFIMDKMRRELPVQMVYHDINHTIDVCKAAERIGREEKLTEPELDLLLTAAHYHDCGYINGVKDHEEASCYMAKQYLPGFGYSPGDIEVICGMIRATQIPQSPQNILERILADADLDYLGRDDFFKIGNQLYSELAAMGILKTADEWNRLQESFLESHHYFTHTAIQSRQSKKQQNLLAVKAKLHNKGNRRGFHLPQPVADIIYTLVGILFCGFALKGFLVPNKYFDGGVTGISLLIHELYHFNIAYVIILANLPLIIMGGFQISVNFALRTFAAVVGLGLCLLLIPYPQITSDKLLVSIFGGIFMGIGVGLAMRGGCALDGIEVLAMYTGKRVSFTISEIILGINIIIFLVAAIKLGFYSYLLYSFTHYQFRH